MANNADPDQTAPIGAVCSGSTLFASWLNSPVMLGNYLQQTTSVNKIFRCIFVGALRVNIIRFHYMCYGGIEKSVMKTVWHHEACRVMTNSDH